MTVTETPKRTDEMTAREYAVSLGLAKMGRGRMSPLATAAIDEAIANGVTFKEPAHVIAARERAENPKRTRKPRVETVSVGNVDFRGNPNPADPHDGTPNRPDKAWYERVFGFGNFVCNPQGLTLRVTCEKMDAEGFTSFIDNHGKGWKAKVNASWGVRQGWPTSTSNA